MFSGDGVLNMFLVGGAERIGDEQFKWLADDVFGGVAEYLLGRPVEDEYA